VVSPRHDNPYRGDPLFSLLLHRWGLGESGFAILTAFAGFGVLAVWHCLLWLVDPATRALRGMFEYHSATFGDSILLPLVGAAAVRYAGLVAEGFQGLRLKAAPASPSAGRLRRLVRHAYERRAALVFALVVVAAAVGLEHVDEVYGSDRNWTVPMRGQPRLVAYYHEAFFGFQAYVVAFLLYRHVATVRLLRRLLAGGAAERAALASLAERSLRLFGWTLVAWGAFVALRVLDFCYLMPGASFAALATLPTPMLILGVYYAACLVGGLWPLLAFSRGLVDGTALAGLALPIAAAFAAPVLPSLACIFVAP
jgi:hypothetical protein